MKLLLHSLLLMGCLITGKYSLAQDSSIVYFDFDRYDLSVQARHTLDSLFSKPYLYDAVIYGHTDQLGKVSYNKILSEKRANAVKDYIISRGIDAAKLILIKGLGETMPAINQLDASSRQANRRVVIITRFELRAKDSIITNAAPEVPPQIIAEKPVPPSKETLIDEISDTATREGDNIILKNINFYGGRHVFLPQSFTALSELLYVMRAIPTLEIEIQGHICCQAGEGDGMDMDTGEPFLSHNRARAVYEYLLAKGISKNRMSYKGYGHRYPLIAVERTEAERTMNRRVEIKIVKK